MKSEALNHDKLSVAHVFSEAWHLVKGCKGPVWAILILVIPASIVLGVISASLFHINSVLLYIGHILMPLINAIAMAPFFGGAMMVAVKQARHEPITGKTGYYYLHRTMALIITMVIIAFLAHIFSRIILPLVALAWLLQPLWIEMLTIGAINAIFMLVVYTLTALSIPLLLDQNQSPISALKLSYRYVKPHFFKVLLIILLLPIISGITGILAMIGQKLGPYVEALGFILFGVLHIWLFPFFFLVIAILYRRLVNQQTPSQDSLPHMDTHPSEMD